MYELEVGERGMATIKNCLCLHVEKKTFRLNKEHRVAKLADDNDINPKQVIQSVNEDNKSLGIYLLRAIGQLENEPDFCMSE